MLSEIVIKQMAPKTSNHKSVVQACSGRDDISATTATEKMSVLVSKIFTRHYLPIIEKHSSVK